MLSTPISNVHSTNIRNILFRNVIIIKINFNSNIIFMDKHMKREVNKETHQNILVGIVKRRKL